MNIHKLIFISFVLLSSLQNIIKGANEPEIDISSKVNLTIPSLNWSAPYQIVKSLDTLLKKIKAFQFNESLDIKKIIITVLKDNPTINLSICYTDNPFHVNGVNALHYAAECNFGLSDYSEIIELLIEMGLDVDTQDENGNTPLIWASEGGNYEAVQKLLKKGANVEHKNLEGFSAIYFAAKHKRNGQKIVKLLLESKPEQELIFNDLSLDEIAHQNGYIDIANYIREFKNK